MPGLLLLLSLRGFKKGLWKSSYVVHVVYEEYVPRPTFTSSFVFRFAVDLPLLSLHCLLLTIGYEDFFLVILCLGKLVQTPSCWVHMLLGFYLNIFRFGYLHGEIADLVKRKWKTPLVVIIFARECGLTTSHVLLATS